MIKLKLTKLCIQLWLWLTHLKLGCWSLEPAHVFLHFVSLEFNTREKDKRNRTKGREREKENISWYRMRRSADRYYSHFSDFLQERKKQNSVLIKFIPVPLGSSLSFLISPIKNRRRHAERRRRIPVWNRYINISQTPAPKPC